MSDHDVHLAAGDPGQAPDPETADATTLDTSTLYQLALQGADHQRERAAITLLHRHDRWLTHSGFLRTCVEYYPPTDMDGPLVLINWRAVGPSVGAGGPDGVVGTGSEVGMLLAAASLADYSNMVQLGELIDSLDPRNQAIFAEAIGEAMGR